MHAIASTGARATEMQNVAAREAERSGRVLDLQGAKAQHQSRPQSAATTHTHLTCLYLPQVAQSGDPTAHAEIRAINIASQRLRERGFATGENGGAGEDYKGYTFFILTDPCPMCMAAMHYAGPDEVGEETKRERERSIDFK